MVGRAIAQVKGFNELYQEFEDKVLISGHSPGALENYSRKVARVCLHFDRLPQHINEKDLNPIDRLYKKVLSQGMNWLR